MLGGVLRVEVDGLADVRTVRSGDLDPFLAPGACDEHDLPLDKVMEPLEDMDAAQGDPLPGTAVGAGVGHLVEEPVDEPADQGAHGLRRHRKRRVEAANGLAREPEEPLDARVGPERDVPQAQ